MAEALTEARAAREAAEVPVGAIITNSAGEIIARGRNRMEGDLEATSHAELIAIRAASKVLGNWRLNGCTLFVTLEPCTMCIGAIRLARLDGVVFATHDPRLGAVGTLYDLASDARLGGNPPWVVSGICAEESAEMLKSFFIERRRS